MKGSVFDVLVITVIILIVSIMILFVYVMENKMYAGLHDAGFSDGQLAPISVGIDILAGFNYLILFLYVMLQLTTILSAFAVRSHPIYFVVFVIMQVVILFIMPTIGSIYTTIADNPAISIYAGTFSWVRLLFENLSVLTLIFSFIIVIAMNGIPGLGARTSDGYG